MTVTEPRGNGGPPPGSVTRADWGGFLFPPQVQDLMLSQLLTGSPFAQALTRLVTGSGSVVWPLVSPEGAAWLAEMQTFPNATLNDDVYIAEVKKIGNKIDLSNESIADAPQDLSITVGRCLADSFGPVIDKGLLYGEDGVEPQGVVARAIASTPAPDFRSAVIGAWGELVAAGAPPANVTVFAHPVPLAKEWARTNDNGTPIHDDASAGSPLTLGPGIRTIAVPMLQPEDVLAVDVSYVFFVVRDAVEFEGSPYPSWDRDSLSIRVKGRVAVAAPVPGRSLRTVSIEGPGQGSEETEPEKRSAPTVTAPTKQTTPASTPAKK